MLGKSYCKIDTLLYSSYDTHDLRKKLFFERNNDGKPALIDEKIGAQNVKNYLTIETSNYLYLIISLSVALLVSGLIVILLIYLKRRKKDEQTKN